MRPVRLVPVLLLAGCSLFEVEPIPPFEPPYGGLTVEEREAVAQLVLTSLTAPALPSAELVVYNCPDILDGCNAAAYRVDGVCYPFAAPKIPGACDSTGIRLGPGVNHLFAVSGHADCSSSSQDANAPYPGQLFFEQVYYLGGTVYCRDDCEAPTDCADVE